MEVGPPLRKMFWNVPKRCGLKPFVTTLDLKQAFFHIRISKNERDVMRFGLIKDDETLQKQDFDFHTSLTVRWFTDFGTVVITNFAWIYICICTIKHHLEQYQQDEPQTVLDSKQSICVADMIGRKDCLVCKAVQVKRHQNFWWNCFQIA